MFLKIFCTVLANTTLQKSIEADHQTNVFGFFNHFFKTLGSIYISTEEKKNTKKKKKGETGNNPS